MHQRRRAPLVRALSDVHTLGVPGFRSDGRVNQLWRCRNVPLDCSGQTLSRPMPQSGPCRDSGMPGSHHSEAMRLGIPHSLGAPSGKMPLTANGCQFPVSRCSVAGPTLARAHSLSPASRSPRLLNDLQVAEQSVQAARWYPSR